jgi:hypothetical protein
MEPSASSCQDTVDHFQKPPQEIKFPKADRTVVTYRAPVWLNAAQVSIPPSLR